MKIIEVIRGTTFTAFLFRYEGGKLWLMSSYHYFTIFYVTGHIRVYSIECERPNVKGNGNKSGASE
ncbi:hypothetical protein PISMIDRAFT_317259 [Pisolithus microcarpus 441]|uniref:Unplaced genomic scaffold scaffold_20, whole genome shotgun sequence n=1 Tax=Pisolithus microcarpus 441 TaxID=765257 RepID=A0A0C9ZA15_9AGAM|nr:hypothetical protein PISMIDRAFT_317259 [Pisolithus microcarpus 441]